MQKVEPQEQHRWLEQLLGEWSVRNEAPMPGQDTTAEWVERVRSLDGIWFISDGEGDAPGCGPVKTQLTLGYDPARQRFVGTWIGSMMSHMWVYEGSLDDSGKTLILDCEGPDFERPGEMTRYQDVVTIIDRHNRRLASRMQKPDGSWSEIMSAHYRRRT